MQALLIIDVQNDYFPGGKYELVGVTESLAKIQIVLEKFRTMKQPIIFVKHINTRVGAIFFLPNIDGVEIRKEIEPLAEEPVIVKHAPDSFYQTELLKLLQSKSIDELVICGMMTHMCIDTTVRAAKSHGYAVTVLADACATRDLTWEETTIPAKVVQQVYLASLNGSFAEIVDTDMCLTDSKIFFKASFN